MQTALQPIRLFCFILALSCLYQHLWARCALVFQYKGQTQFMIDDSGNVIDARIIQNAADATPDEALIIEKNHQLMLWAHDNHVFIPGALHECTDTAAYPNTGLQFESGVGHAAELTDAGDLYISGKESVRQPTAMVTYVDNSAVYELNADKVNELQYHHLGTPLGTEGRIFTDNRTEFYVRDHLGSVRSVIAERPNGQGYEVVEYTSYYHYGSIKDALERPGQVREKFTGKELDEDGQGNGSPGLQLYYFGARFYDPVVGVWIGVDPAGQFSTPYAYAGNGYNPINGVDPQGLWMDSGEKGKEARDKGISARLDRGERAGVNDDKGHIGAQFTEAERVDVARLEMAAKNFTLDAYQGFAFVDALQFGLDIAGLIPGLGEPFDLANAGISALRGDWIDAGLGLAAAVPIIGSGAPFAKKITKFKAFDKLGIKYTKHFKHRLIQRAIRGITVEGVLDAYTRGRLFYNPTTKNYIRHSTKTGISVVIDAPFKGKIITVFEGKISPDWLPIKWKEGL